MRTEASAHCFSTMSLRCSTRRCAPPSSSSTLRSFSLLRLLSCSSISSNAAVASRSIASKAFASSNLRLLSSSTTRCASWVSCKRLDKACVLSQPLLTRSILLHSKSTPRSLAHFAATSASFSAVSAARLHAAVRRCSYKRAAWARSRRKRQTSSASSCSSNLGWLTCGGWTSCGPNLRWLMGATTGKAWNNCGSDAKSMSSPTRTSAPPALPSSSPPPSPTPM
mmetsp:Transcript_23009/g.64682  ORF Transcript_23009/g.64682 Transcript_23009/m.64682 type:complete len:224 (+) Transcript_23009:656-1327(+)